MLSNWYDDLGGAPRGHDDGGTVRAAYADFDFADISEDATIKYNLEQKKERDALLELAKQPQEPDPLEQLSTEELKAAWGRSIKAAEQEQAGQKQYEAARIFRAETPEYLGADENNAKMVRWMSEHGLDATSPDHYAQAYEALKARGLLYLNELPPQPRPRIDPETATYEQLEEAARNPSRFRR